MKDKTFELEEGEEENSSLRSLELFAALIVPSDSTATSSIVTGRVSISVEGDRL
jgi:hypothetical protein